MLSSENQAGDTGVVDGLRRLPTATLAGIDHRFRSVPELVSDALLAAEIRGTADRAIDPDDVRCRVVRDGSSALRPTVGLGSDLTIGLIDSRRFIPVRGTCYVWVYMADPPFPRLADLGVRRSGRDADGVEWIARSAHRSRMVELRLDNESDSGLCSDSWSEVPTPVCGSDRCRITGTGTRSRTITMADLIVACLVLGWGRFVDPYVAGGHTASPDGKMVDRPVAMISS